MIRGLFTLLCLIGFSVSMAAPNYTDEAEKYSIQIIKLIEKGDLNSAQFQVDELIKRFPNYHTGQLLRNEIKAIKLGLSPNALNMKSEHKKMLNSLRDEVSTRWTHALSPPPKNGIPKQLIKLSSKQHYALLADAKTARLYIFKNEKGIPKLVEHHYMGIGMKGYNKQREGDKLTPLGVYGITRYIDDIDLPDLYGAGAYPINYPNAWDKVNHRTGHGIWIHGVPQTNYSRPPLSSEGCMTINNQALHELAQFIHIGRTPVVISDGVDWISANTWQAQQNHLIKVLTNWERDWESLNNTAYLSHYHKSFKNKHKHYNEWVVHKTRVNKQKKYINVTLSDISIYALAGGKDSVVITFNQRYESNNVSGQNKKSQIWKRFNNEWKIIYEGEALI